MCNFLRNGRVRVNPLQLFLQTISFFRPKTRSLSEFKTIFTRAAFSENYKLHLQMFFEVYRSRLLTKYSMFYTCEKKLKGFLLRVVPKMTSIKTDEKSSLRVK